MNILEILNESILLEAIRINNGREAYELIRNNKLGVKIHPSWKNEEEKYLITVMDVIIKLVGVNDAVFAIQLAANKIPATKDLYNAVMMEILPKLIKFRNRQWAKQIPEYIEFISLNNKPISFKNMESLLNKMNKEAQKHGHGDDKEVKVLYNDGTWTMYTPLSFNGAKAVSFYGKKGEKQIPTQWCTRTRKEWYDRYTSKYHLHVIRNWKTGKSYQMSFGDEGIDFLDQNDVNGDSISQGDITPFPNEMLKRMEFYKEIDFDDYKKKYAEAKNNRKAIVDKTSYISNARWGKEEKIVDGVYRKEWLNYGVNEPLNSYKNNKKINLKRDSAPKYKYYFKDNPKIFVIDDIDSDPACYLELGGIAYDYYEDDFDYDKAEREIKDVDDAEEKFDTLQYYAKQINGSRKRAEREELQSYIFNNGESSITKIRNYLNKNIKKDLTDYISKLLNKKINIFDLSASGYTTGAILPKSISFTLSNGTNNAKLKFKNSNAEHINYTIDLDYEFAYEKENKGKIGVNDTIVKKISEYLNPKLKEMAKILIKDKELKNQRNAIRGNKGFSRDGEKGLRKLQFEDYFPY